MKIQFVLKSNFLIYVYNINFISLNLIVAALVSHANQQTFSDQPIIS